MIPVEILAEVQRTYEGSDGDATKALYARLEPLGPRGIIAVNLFRAQKASERAKVYGRRSYRTMAYDRKQWALGNLCEALTEHAAALGIVWGWGEDADQPVHRHVLYIELPTGQVSFHSGDRSIGPDYAATWDGMARMSPSRIVCFVARILAAMVPADG